MSIRKNRADYSYVRIDVPPDMMFTCFCCGCIATEPDHVPPISRYHDYIAVYDKHPALIVPSCRECNTILGSTIQDTIYTRADHIKRKLIKKAGKYLRLGELWEDEDIEYADFTGQYARMMEAIPSMARAWNKRVEWVHWPVSIDGEVLWVDDTTTTLQVGKKKFTSLDSLYEYARRVDKIPTKYLESVLSLMGIHQLEYTYRLCKTRPIKSEAELRDVLSELSGMLKDEDLVL